MENKYYTPKIEEFHVGFEYEWKRDNEGATPWTKSIMQFDTGPIKDGDAWRINDYRVKYLDLEDIESLGFISLNDLWYIEKHNIRYTLIPINKEFGEHKYEIRPSHPSNYFGGFYGKIKNISELRKLLKQLNIE